MGEKQTEDILVCVTGGSPQVITETLWALHQEKTFFPKRILVLTTVSGKEKIISSLFGPQGGFTQFCKEFKLTEKIKFDADCVKIITTEDDKPLWDIRTDEENTAAGDFITRAVQQLCLETGTRLHISLAGGRKTMSYYLGYALSLFGRDEDKLSHVLISEEYEGIPDFFYPTKGTVRTRTGKKLNKKDAKIDLADIPYVHLRSYLKKRGHLRTKLSFADAISAAQKSLSDTPITVDKKQQTLVLPKGTGIATVNLSPNEMAVYALLARKILKGENLLKINHSVKDNLRDDAPTVIEEFLAELENIRGCGNSFQHTKERLTEKNQIWNFDEFKALVQENKSNINRKIRQGIGFNSKRYQIESKANRKTADISFWLAMDAVHIRIIENN